MDFSERPRAASMTHRIASVWRRFARTSDVHRHLIGGTADTTRLHFHGRLHVVQRLLEQRHSLVSRAIGALGDTLDGAVDDLFGDGLLAALHDHVHELGEEIAAELRVGQDGADLGACERRDMTETLYLFFGRLAPYFERLWRRSLTPAQSSVPRTVW